jgi:hypothetical protein
MNDKSYANGSGNSFANGPDMRTGSPVPKYLLDRSITDAKVMTVTFWDLL